MFALLTRVYWWNAADKCIGISLDLIEYYGSDAREGGRGREYKRKLPLQIIRLCESQDVNGRGDEKSFVACIR